MVAINFLCGNMVSGRGLRCALCPLLILRTVTRSESDSYRGCRKISVFQNCIIELHSGVSNLFQIATRFLKRKTRWRVSCKKELNE